MHISAIAAGGGITEFIRYVFKHKVTVEAVEASDLTTSPVRCAVQLCDVNQESSGACIAQIDTSYNGEPAKASGVWHLDSADEVCAVFQGQAAGDVLFLGLHFKDGWL